MNRSNHHALFCCGLQTKTTQTRYGRRDDCQRCDCRSWGGAPLVDTETREARKAAHEAFDQVWKSGRMSRTAAYRKLAQELGIPEEACHMKLMCAELAWQVARIARAWVAAAARPAQG